MDSLATTLFSYAFETDETCIGALYLDEICDLHM